GRGGMKEFASEPDRQIIGVVADSRDNGLNQEPGPKMFVPQAQIPDLVNALNTRISPMSWVIRTKVSPLSLGAPAQTQLRQGMRLALIGVLVGVAAAYGLSRYMSSLLFGVEARDPLVFIGVPLLLAFIALLAVWIPAGRASRIDPLGALRSA